MKLYNGDCLVELENIPDNSVHLVVTDPPYGTLKHNKFSWDVMIPFEPLWEQLKRVLVPSGTVCIFGQEPFSSLLRISNLEWYKYDWLWRKTHSPDFLHAKSKPRNFVENISVFSEAVVTKMKYKPQGLKECLRRCKTGTRGDGNFLYSGKVNKEYVQEVKNYPNTIIEFSNFIEDRAHPTQKPVELLYYLIETYSDEGDVVLDYAFGSGSTGIASVLGGRDFIGIEKDPNFYIKAVERIDRYSRSINE